MTDFLLELRSEEIPARMQAKARDDLARLFAAELAKAGLTTDETVTYATPRRLALIARGLPDATVAVSEETKGPRTTAPDQAIEGFLRKTGLSRDQLVERDGTLFAVVEKPGRATAEVLAEAIPAIIRQFPWPKSMRWGAASVSTESLRWVRPLHGVVALLGEQIVECEVAGIRSGAITKGHRFHHPGAITIGSAADYVEKLHASHVIVDQNIRQRYIRQEAEGLAKVAEFTLVEDEELVVENAGLTEWPEPILGFFDEAFLDVPPEVIQLTARVNQKYFVCQNPHRHGGVASQSDVGEGSPPSATPIDSPLHHASGAVPLPVNGEDLDSLAGSHQSSTLMGALANAFICVANIDASDGGAAIVEGNRKVLAARLADARFFYETDLKTPLEEQARKLEHVVFHEKLGTLADKVDRVAKLARWLVEEGIVTPLPSGEWQAPTGARGEGRVEPLAASPQPSPRGADAPGSSPDGRGDLAALAERAARLAKADLVTGMVGEFPELQGVMGGYYARAQGEPREVWEAIRDHYKPVGQGDDVPTAPVTVAVSLADKLDTIVAFFAIDQKPTGSKDPFALRRAALAAIAMLTAHRIRFRLRDLLLEVASVANNSLRRQFDDHMQQNDIYWDREEICPDEFAFRLNLMDGEWDTRPRDIAIAVLATLRATQLNFESHERVSEVAGAVADFFADRLKVQQREAGVRHDLIDAVFALGGEDDLVRLLARVRALQAFVGTEDGANLLAGYKRAANILKKEGVSPPPAGGRGSGGGRPADRAASPAETASPPPSPVPPAGGGAKTLSYTPEKAETALIAALDAAEPAAARAVDEEDFEAAMAALATLRGPIDAFFDTVTVNDPDPARREARLALLARVRGAVHEVADFSKIEG